MTATAVIAIGKRDDDVAKELLARLKSELEPVIKTLDELKSHGMVGNFSLGLDQFGRNVIQSASIVKVIA